MRACLWAVLTLSLASTCHAQTAQAVEQTYRQLASAVSVGRLRHDYRALSSPASRLAGSFGEAAALDLAEKRFRTLGFVNVRREPFSVTVPDPNAVGTITGPSWSSAVYPLWPNLVRTSTCDVEGPLVYCGDGSLASLKGKTLEGAIAVVEFDSGSNWRNAVKLGARATIFIASGTIRRAEAEAKFAAVPLNAPRFLIRMEEAGPLLRAAIRRESARLRCRQDWVRLQSANLLADLPGGSGDERVLVMAYADAPSVVPALAPGAEAAGSLAALLEVATLYAKRPHKRLVTFCVSGAHFLGLQGAREFVQNRLEGDHQKIFLAVTLDIDSGSSGLAALSRGWFYEYRDESQVPMVPVGRAMRFHADRIAPIIHARDGREVLLDAINGSDGRSWRNDVPGKFATDAEPFVQAGYTAVTLATADSSKPFLDSPSDTPDRVNFANVRKQVQTIACLMHHILNDTSDRRAQTDYKIPIETTGPTRMSLTGGFATIEGRVALYDPKKSFVPDTGVPESLAILASSQKTMMGVRGDIVSYTTGTSAQYRLIGAPQISSFPWDSKKRTLIEAYHCDPATGDIIYAPSLGVFGAEAYPTFFDLKQAYKSTPIVVFRCQAIDMHDLFDPQEFKTLFDVKVIDPSSGAAPRDYGFHWTLWDRRMNAEVESSFVYFGAPGERFKFLMGSEFGETRLILTNASPQNPDGIGYLVPGGNTREAGRDGELRTGTFRNLALNAARDYYILNQSRIEHFNKYRIISQGISDLQLQAKESLDEAASAVEKKDWPELERASRAAWSYSLRVHPIVQKTANDVVNGVLFYLFLLIPFSYFLERLLFGSRSLTKQLAWSGFIFILSFSALRYIHPAFEIVSNPSMIFVGFIMGVLSVLVITFILGKFEASLKALKLAESGIHEIDIGRVSVALAAFNLGIGNMRRRKARTILTTLTLVVMTFIVLSFTSIVPELQLRELPSNTPGRYAGLLLRMPGLEPLEASTYRSLANEFEDRASIARRAWYYGAEIGDTGVLRLTSGDQSLDVRAVLGLEASEVAIARPQEALLPGGRWFEEGDQRVLILPRETADALNIASVDVGKAQVNFAGETYTVIGIIDSAQWRSFLDLDGESLTPADFALSRRYQREESASNAAFRPFIRLDPSNVCIMPLGQALNLGADIRSVALAFNDPAASTNALTDLMPRLRLNLYAATPTGNGLAVRQFSVQQGSKGSGMALVVIQLLIAAVFVLNTMIAAVFERTREISIFSAIGLAPNHISMLFFAESLVYGVLGSVIGYVIAQLVARVVIATGAFPGLYLNFSSVSAVMATALVLGVVLLSTVYPARIAARIAAPALNEEAFNVEPKGDRWSIDLPFNISAAEASPLIEFLGEWFSAYEEYTIGTFVTANTGIASPAPDHFSCHTKIWLAPYDLGVSQQVSITASPTPYPNVYSLRLEILRLEGEPSNWVTVNRRFLTEIRKQFLTWRTLTDEQRDLYRERADATFALA
jgi:hypothetical protein